MCVKEEETHDEREGGLPFLTWVCACGYRYQEGQKVTFPGAGVPLVCELSDIGAENQTQVLFA